MKYSEQLLQPEWKQKRQEIIDLADGKCEVCANIDNYDTLHVHHGVYIKGKMAWEYPNEVLYCLCATCHWNIQEDMDRLYFEIGKRGIDLDRIRVMIQRNFETREQSNITYEKAI